MRSLRAVIFDLGGTLVDWPDWDGDSPRRWAMSYDHLTRVIRRPVWPDRQAYVDAMRDAELAHWRRVEAEQWSGPPSGLIHEGFRRLNLPVDEAVLGAALDGYAHAVEGWAVPFPDARATLRLLRERGYRLGLLSNTWWAPEWHEADLVTHGLAELLDEVVYTSNLPRSKPHPTVFQEVAARLDVEASSCVMIGDRMIDDVAGALGAGMRAVWKANDRPWPRPDHVVPHATVTYLAEVPDLLPRLDQSPA